MSRTGSGIFERVLGDTVSGRTIDASGVYQPGPIYFFPGYDSLDVSRYEVLLEVTNTNDAPADVELTLLGDGTRRASNEVSEVAVRFRKTCWPKTAGQIGSSPLKRLRLKGSNQRDRVYKYSPFAGYRRYSGCCSAQRSGTVANTSATGGKLSGAGFRT